MQAPETLPQEFLGDIALKCKKSTVKGMPSHNIQRWFFLALLIGTLILAFFIFRPYLPAVVLATTFAVIFYPIHKYIHAAVGEKDNIAALLSTFLVLLVFFVPLGFFAVEIFEQARDLYFSVNTGEEGVRTTLDTFIPAAVEAAVPRLEVDLQQLARQGLNWVVEHLGQAFAGVAKVFLSAFLSLLALFYLFRDGEKLKKKIVDLSPLYNTHDRKIFARLELAVNSVIRGALVVALIQGIVTGIGLVIFGVPNPALWGSVAAVAALVPTVGTGAVIIPAVAYLFFTNNMGQAVGLAIWGITAVGLIDNILGPKLIQKGLKVHPLLILLSVLGGITFFGPIGFVIGPIVLSFLVALLDIYPVILKSESTGK